MDGADSAAHFKNRVVYTDGSCLKEGHHSFARAGWAVTCISADGALQGARWGKVGARPSSD